VFPPPDRRKQRLFGVNSRVEMRQEGELLSSLQDMFIESGLMTDQSSGSMHLLAQQFNTFQALFTDFTRLTPPAVLVLIGQCEYKLADKTPEDRPKVKGRGTNTYLRAIFANLEGIMGCREGQ